MDRKIERRVEDEDVRAGWCPLRVPGVQHGICGGVAGCGGARGADELEAVDWGKRERIRRVWWGCSGDAQGAASGAGPSGSCGISRNFGVPVGAFLRDVVGGIDGNSIFAVSALEDENAVGNSRVS